MRSQRYIRIRNWEKFQHYKKRRPVWIKVYVSLLDDPNYLELEPFQRGVLHGLWLLAAKTDNKISASPAYLMHALGVNLEAEYREATGRSLDGDRTATGRASDMIRKRIGRTLDTLIRLEWLEECDPKTYHGFLASDLLAKNVRRDSVETEREKETPFVSPLDWADDPQPFPDEPKPLPLPKVDRAPFKEIFDHWQRVRAKPRSKLTKDRETKIRARLKDGYSVEDLKTAIDGVARDPWELRPANDDLALILRDAQHVERFIAFAHNGNGSANGSTPTTAAERYALEVQA